MMLKDLLMLLTESDWALSTIPDVDYVKPLEQYCEKVKPCDVPITFQNCWKTSEDELDRICGSSIPSFFLSWTRSDLDNNVLTELCFSPHLQISGNALTALNSQSEPDSDACSFLRKLKVPLPSTASSSKLVPFAGRLCSSLAADVCKIMSLFSKSSSANPTISAQSTTLPGDLLNFAEKTIVRIILAKIHLIVSLLTNSDISFQNILIDYEFIRLLKSIIVTCLDLLRKLKCESNYPSADRSAALIDILALSWHGASFCIFENESPFHPVIESTFSDIPRLCSLLERTCSHTSQGQCSHLNLLINLTSALPRLIPQLLEENLVQRMINASKPMIVPTTYGEYHKRFFWTFINLISFCYDITEDNEERKRVRKMQFERVLRPAKQYLQFILQREEFFLQDDSSDLDLSTGIVKLLSRTFLLERELFEVGEIVETGREEWEAGWLVEKTDEESLTPRLEKIREDDEKMRMDEKERWKKRVERHRDAGHEDAMEGWLMRVDLDTRSEIEEYIEGVTLENGMNNVLWDRWRNYVYWI
ncbi:hypothetical protein BLNAU_10774 [Blattamonas nauphoetae]|uniref:Uncharacterized protein n=1 Tax=Blattamonas nauphoetae TaxID=2049346 RepID=A0ABQ9XRH5_9EUKA|nr:hypothetical protein BLNAU_10774 [Blattamonas nauphoetae]